MPRSSFPMGRVACALALAASACTPPELAVEINVVTKSCRSGVNPLENAAVLRVTVFGDGIDSNKFQTSVELDQKPINIPNIPVGSGRNVVVEAFARGNNSPLIARGETGPMDFSGKEKKLSLNIFLRKTGQFDYANNAASPDAACTILAKARAGHTATLLENGKVLIAGGYVPGTTGPTSWISTTEIYDPQTGEITDGPSMGQPRAHHTATHIPGTNFTLIAGGEGALPPNRAAGALQSGVLYDESKNTFGDPMQMAAARTRHSAATPFLPGGRQTGAVIFFGGLNSDGKALNTIEFFDKDSGFQMADVTVGATGRGEAAAISIENGIALLGGWTGLSGNPTQPTDTFLLTSAGDLQFGPNAGGSLGSAHIYPMVARLGDGSIVVAGGFSAQSQIEPALNQAVGGGKILKAPGYTETVDIPAIGNGNNTSVNPRGLGGAVTLGDGKVLVAGGGSGAGVALNDAFLIYRNANTMGIGASATGAMVDKRVDAAYVALKDGTVLITGGYDFSSAAGTALNTLELYQPIYVVSGDEAHQQ